MIAIPTFSKALSFLWTPRRPSAGFVRVAMSIAIAALLMTNTAARADEPPSNEAPGASSLANDLTGSAKADYLAARSLLSDGDFAAALVKLTSALEASGDKRLLWNIASCHRGMRHYAEAIRSLERFKVEGGPTVTETLRTNATEIIDGLRPYVGVLTVHASEQNASVYIDDKLAGTTPLDRYLVDLGEHSIVVKKDKLSDYKKRINVPGSADIVLDAVLVHEGRVVVRAGANDAIAIDGRVVAASSYEGALSTGAHTLRVSAPGMRTSEQAITIADGETQTFDITLDRSGLPLWAWIGIGTVSAAGVATLGYFLFRPERPDPVNGTLAPGTHQLGLIPRF